MQARRRRSRGRPLRREREGGASRGAARARDLSQLWLDARGRRLTERDARSGQPGERGEPAVLIRDLDADRVDAGVPSTAPREDVAAVGLQVAARRERVRDRDGRSAEIAGGGAAAVVDVVVRADLAAVLVRPVDLDLLQLDRTGRRDDVALDPVEDQAVRPEEASTLGGEHRAVATRKQHGVPRVPDEGELDDPDDQQKQQREEQRELHERLSALLPATEWHGVTLGRKAESHLNGEVTLERGRSG